MEVASATPGAALQRDLARRDGRSLAETKGEADELFLPAPIVASRYHVSDMTLYRWLRDERMQFPGPHYFGRFRYWRLSDLTAWERERVSAPPQANAR
jgi:predicted DNA-binding transcriptional regulator AlpA